MQPLTIDCSELTPSIGKISLAGTVDHTNISSLKSAIEQSFKKGIYKLIVNLKQAEYIASSGIACFITSLDVATAKGGHMIFIAAPPQIQRIAELLGLSEVFAFADDESAALRLLAK